MDFTSETMSRSPNIDCNESERIIRDAENNSEGLRLWDRDIDRDRDRDLRDPPSEGVGDEGRLDRSDFVVGAWKDINRSFVFDASSCKLRLCSRLLRLDRAEEGAGDDVRKEFTQLSLTTLELRDFIPNEKVVAVLIVAVDNRSQ